MTVKIENDINQTNYYSPVIVTIVTYIKSKITKLMIFPLSKANMRRCGNVKVFLLVISYCVLLRLSLQHSWLLLYFAQSAKPEV